ncbi:hypothetical protein ACI65C_009783 [Semiaphis heraclei]
MKVKRNLTSGILLIIATIIMTTDSVVKKGGPSRLKKAKDSIMQLFTISPKMYNKWQSSNFNNDYNRLLDLLSNEADLIKIGAFKKLNRMFNSATNNEVKKKLVLAKLQATVELVRYYGAVGNWPMTKYTFGQGLFIAHECARLQKDNAGECLKKKTQLYIAAILCNGREINRIARFYLNKSAKDTNKYLGKGDITLHFLDIKMSCEVKLSQENRNIIIKTAKKMYMGGYSNYDCVRALIPFESHIKEIDSYPGEYHYLIARAYVQQGNNELALDHLRKARQAPVVDAKTRETNKKVQAFYEKTYTRMNANVR